MRSGLALWLIIAPLSWGCGRLFYDPALGRGEDGGANPDAPADGGADASMPGVDGGSDASTPGVDAGPVSGDGGTALIDATVADSSTTMDAGGTGTAGPARCTGAVPGSPLGEVDARRGEFLRAVLDGDCHVHATYFDDTTGNIRYATFDGVSWAVSDLEYVWMHGHSAIAVDRSGRVFVVFNSLPDYSLKLATREPGASTWTIEVIEALGMPSQAFYISLVLGSDGTLHVGYFSQATSGVRYAFRPPAGDWTFEDAFPAADHTRLALGPGDEPHVVARTYADTDLHYASRDGTGWHPELIDSTGNMGWDVDIVVAGDGTLHIAYRYLTYSELRYAHLESGGWVVEVLDGVADVHSGYGSSLALDSMGRPHIATRRGTSASGPWDLAHVWHDGSTWQVRSSPVAASDDNTALVIDGTDRVLILYSTTSAVRVAPAP